MFNPELLTEIRRLVHPVYSDVKPTSVSQDASRQNLVMVIPVPGEQAITLPYPAVSYVHADGCHHSKYPDILLKSLSEVKLMDTMATVRLNNILRLLRSGCKLDEHVDVETDPIDESDSGDHEPIHTTVGVKVQQFAVPTMDDADAEPKFKHYLRFTSTVVRDHLVAEVARLRRSLALKPSKKAVYYKRCNLEWRNLVGHVLPAKEVARLEQDGRLIRAFQPSSHEGLVKRIWHRSEGSAHACCTDTSFEAKDYGYALLNYHKISLGPDLKSASVEEAAPPSRPVMPAPVTPRFETQILLALEAQVRSGKIPHHTMCMRAWEFNEQVHKKGRSDASSNVCQEVTANRPS